MSTDCVAGQSGTKIPRLIFCPGATLTTTMHQRRLICHYSSLQANHWQTSVVGQFIGTLRFNPLRHIQLFSSACWERVSPAHLTTTSKVWAQNEGQQKHQNDHLTRQFFHFCGSNQRKRQQQAVSWAHAACPTVNWSHGGQPADKQCGAAAKTPKVYPPVLLRSKTKTRVSITVKIITSLPPV